MTPEIIKSLLITMYQKEFSIENYVNIYDIETQLFQYRACFEYSLAEADIITEIELLIEGTIEKDCGTIEYYNPIGDGRMGEKQGDGNFIKSWGFTDIGVFKNGVRTDIKITLDDLEVQQTILNN